MHKTENEHAYVPDETTNMEVENAYMVKPCVIEMHRSIQQIVQKYHEQHEKGYDIPFYATIGRLVESMTDTLMEICCIEKSSDFKDIVAKRLGILDVPSEEVAEEILDLVYAWHAEQNESMLNHKI